MDHPATLMVSVVATTAIYPDTLVVTAAAHANNTARQDSQKRERRLGTPSHTPGTISPQPWSKDASSTEQPTTSCDFSTWPEHTQLRSPQQPGEDTSKHSELKIRINSIFDLHYMYIEADTDDCPLHLLINTGSPVILISSQLVAAEKMQPVNVNIRHKFVGISRKKSQCSRYNKCNIEI
jgi:hypothetical protein